MMADQAPSDSLVIDEKPSQKILNINVGVLGHVDSGKTTLAKTLSTHPSTAAFDKNPQSKERGITLDLGFSAFYQPAPEQLTSICDVVQYTLVDCPGHASLIRTIIGGAQIMDIMILVIDVTKGIQTQTAECLVIGELTTDRMLLVLNKIDQLAEEGRQKAIERVENRIRKVLSTTKFADAPMVAISASIPTTSSSSSGSGDIDGVIERKWIGIEELLMELARLTPVPQRSVDGPFLFAVDHCFPIKGQGTVMTGTILRGSVKVNEIIEIPSLALKKKVKSMQMFHKPVISAMQGDRLGICVTQFDSKLMERGFVCEPLTIQAVQVVVISLAKVRFFKAKQTPKMKFHISVGHTTVMSTAVFFGLADGEKPKEIELKTTHQISPAFPIEEGKEYEFREQMFDSSSEHPIGSQWALLHFDSPVLCPSDSLLIGSKLDSDIHSNSCRIAFHGRIVKVIDLNDRSTFTRQIRIFKLKQREGSIDRIVDDYNIIGKGLFKKETNIELFVGLKIKHSTAGEGIIEGSFGKSGKFKATFPQSISGTVDNRLILNYKKFVFDKSSKISQ